MTLTLNEANGWYKSVSGLDPDHNTYTLREIVPSGSTSILAGYTLNGNDLTISEGLVTVTPGTVIATNTIPNGALQLQKLVKVKGNAPTPGEGGNTDRVDGAYLFTVTGPTSYAPADRITK